MSNLHASMHVEQSAGLWGRAEEPHTGPVLRPHHHPRRERQCSDKLLLREGSFQIGTHVGIPMPCLLLFIEKISLKRLLPTLLYSSKMG